MYSMPVRGTATMAICRLLLALALYPACTPVCRAMIAPPGASICCCCGACVNAVPIPPTYDERLKSTLARLDSVDRAMRALPGKERFLPVMATERGTIQQLADSVRTLLATDQSATTLETTVSTVEAAVNHYALWPLRAQILSAAGMRQQPEPTWGLLSGSEFMHVTENLLPSYAEPAIALNGMRGESLSTHLMVFPFDQALVIPVGDDGQQHGITVDSLADGAGHVIAPARWSLMMLIPWWRCLDGAAAPVASTANGAAWCDALHPLQQHERVIVPLGAVVTLRCRVDIPVDQPPGAYHGAVHLAPLGQPAQAVPITVTVWPATVPVAWRLPVEAGTQGDLASKAADPAVREIGSAYHLAVATEQAASPHQGWYRVGEPGPLSLNAQLLAIRLLPWDAWAKHSAGITIPVLYQWRWTAQPTTRVDGQLIAPMLPPCPGAIGDLVYPSAGSADLLQPSVRLEVFRDGLDDVACLRQLADALQQGTVLAADRDAVRDVLEQARRLARMPTGPEAINRFRQIRPRLAELLSHLPAGATVQVTKETENGNSPR